MSKFVFVILILSMRAGAEVDCLKSIGTDVPRLQNTLFHTQPLCKAVVDLAEAKSKEPVNLFLEDFNEKERKSRQVAFDTVMGCQQALFDQCFSNLKPIDEKKLNSEFQNWIKDPLLRMYSPNGMCLSRAAELSLRLTKAGYKTKIIQINSPIIVGIFKDSNGQVKGSDQYGDGIEPYSETAAGFHYVVEVETKMANGEIQGKLLDPQFMDKPMDREEYSLLVTGQKSKNEKSNPMFTKFKELPPNINDASFHMAYNFRKEIIRLTDPCGWHSQYYDRAIISGFNSKELPSISKENFTETTLSEVGVANVEEYQKHLLRKGLSEVGKKVESDQDKNKKFLQAYEEGYYFNSITNKKIKISDLPEDQKEILKLHGDKMKKFMRSAEEKYNQWLQNLEELYREYPNLKSP